MIRPYNTLLDDAYIYSTWTKYAWYHPVEPIHMHKKTWFKNKIQEIKSILQTGSTHVACFKGAPEVIAGYIVVLGGEVKWMCVKKKFHDQGIEKFLVKSMKEKLTS